MVELRRLLHGPRPVAREILATTGLIYLVTAGAALPFIAFGVGDPLKAIGLLALMGVPILAGGLLVLSALGVVHLVALTIRHARTAVRHRPKRLKPPGLW